MMKPIVFSAIALERMAFGRNMGVASNFLIYLKGKVYADKIFAIQELEDIDKQREELRKLPSPHTGRGTVRTLLALSAIGQVALGILLWQAFGWPLFGIDVVPSAP
jgi:hypothetical protein